MSGPYDFPMGVPPLATYNPSYPVYDQHYGAFQRVSAPATPHEGVGFWYRPDTQDGIYHQDPALFNRAMPMPPVTMESQAAIKHRRTRSGCFTCRSRRVKCDETRPICDRCRKGNRECGFPPNAASAKKAKAAERIRQADNHGSDLSTIKDESEDSDAEAEEEEASPASLQAPSQEPSAGTKRSRPKPHSVLRRQPSSKSEATTKAPGTPLSETSELGMHESSDKRCLPPKVLQRWKKLKPDLRPQMEMYLKFRYEHMTHYHYFFKMDPEDFVHEELVDLALQFEPLLLAVVAFAAYHHTIRQPDSEAEFQSFWKYYCKSISKLTQYLKENGEKNDLLLLTVLQLATFEEYMGDWTHVTHHHRAAHDTLVSRYTPETIMASDLGRKIFDWYARLDVIVGLMSMHNIALDRKWLKYAHRWYKERAFSDDESTVNNKLEYFSKGFELMGQDIASTFAGFYQAFEQPDFSIEVMAQQMRQVHDRVDALREEVQELNNPELTGIDEDIAQTEDDLFNPCVPLFQEELWPLNLVWLNWYGLHLMLTNQCMVVMQKAQQLYQSSGQPTPQADQMRQDLLSAPRELTQTARTQCEIFNAIISSPSAPKGARLILHANMGFSAVFLPCAPPESNSKYTKWARLQLAGIELEGYVWPPSFRKQMAMLWSDPSIETWWFPHGEGKPKILEEIHAVVEDRITAMTNRGDGKGNDLREIKGIFENFENMSISREGSADTFDPAFISSNAGMAHAASMVSSPEDNSTGSQSGLSPRFNHPDSQSTKNQPKSRKGSGASAKNESVSKQPNAGYSNRMSGIWEGY